MALLRANRLATWMTHDSMLKELVEVCDAETPKPARPEARGGGPASRQFDQRSTNHNTNVSAIINNVNSIVIII